MRKTVAWKTPNDLPDLQQLLFRVNVLAAIVFVVLSTASLTLYTLPSSKVLYGSWKVIRTTGFFNASVKFQYPVSWNGPFSYISFFRRAKVWQCFDCWSTIIQKSLVSSAWSENVRILLEKKILREFKCSIDETDLHKFIS